MNFFFWQKKRTLLTDEENRIIVKAIRHAEEQTSGEVRVFVESRCSWMDAIDRAVELFYGLKMQQTEQRNAVLIYAALKDKQLAIFGDEGIHQKVGNAYWVKAVQEMLLQFDHANYAKGIAECVIQVGEALRTHFPFDRTVDKNELPDAIIFGR